MSTSEIISIIKAINDEVTNNHCESIVAYFNQKTNVQQLFERQFFNSMDQAVQKLINDIIDSIKSASSCQYHASVVPKHILTLIQRQCITYNQLKKNIYDNHLAKIKQFEKDFCGILQQMLREKGVHQNTLFDNALRNQVTTQNINQDIVNLLNLCQNDPNAKNVQVASNTAQNTPNINMDAFATDIHNAFASPMETLSPNHIDKPNEINQLLSIISQLIENTPSNTNVTSNNPFTIPNGDENTNRNDDTVFTSQNGASDLYNNSNSNSSDSNNNKNTTNTTKTPQNVHNTHNEKNYVSNNHVGSSQLKHLIAPVHSRSKTVPKKLRVPKNEKQANISSNGFDNIPANILPSFSNTNIMNNNVNSVNNNSNNRNAFPHSDTTSQMSSTQFSMNGNDESKTNTLSSGKQTIVSRAPSAPPKPPPPTIFVYDKALNVSSSDDNDDSDHGYECTLCNIMFDTAKEWKTHLRKAHLKTRSKKKKLKQSEHKKNKRIRKRSFNKMVNESNNHSYDIVNTFNKRRRQITHQCEQHDKQYSRPSSYSTHYNHRKENTKDLEMLKLFSLRGMKNNDR